MEPDVSGALLAAVQQAPALCVLAFVVWTFLRYLKHDGDDRRTFMAQQNEATRSVLATLTMAMTTFTGEMKELTEAVGRHDAFAREAIADLREERRVRRPS